MIDPWKYAWYWPQALWPYRKQITPPRSYFCYDPQKANLAWLVCEEADQGLEAIPEQVIVTVNSGMTKDIRQQLGRLPLDFMKYAVRPGVITGTVLEDLGGVNLLPLMRRRAAEAQARLITRDEGSNLIRIDFTRKGA